MKCKHCGKRIMKNSAGWLHFETGWLTCVVNGVLLDTTAEPLLL